jgi:hypothetical protein
LFLNDYGLLWAEMGCLDGGLGDSQDRLRRM